MKKSRAIKLCCESGHTGRYDGRERLHVRDDMILPFVRAAITYADNRANGNRFSRYAAAADRLRDFATVELLCADLGITRRELK